MKLGELWKDLNLDLLVAVTYAPYNSRYNPIEHAPRSNDLTGVVLPATLDGEDKPPSQQSVLSEETIMRKEGVVHDAAMATVSNHWKDKCYDGHPVLPVVISCFDDAKEEEARQQDVMASFNYAGVQALKTNEAMITLKKEYRFLMEHIDRRSHFLSFCKCSRKTCHHCRTQPVTSKRSMKLIQESDGMFTPTPDPSHLGHFKTFWQMVQDITILKQPAEVPDAFSRGMRCHQMFPSHAIIAVMSSTLLLTTPVTGKSLMGAAQLLSPSGTFVVTTMAQQDARWSSQPTMPYSNTRVRLAISPPVADPRRNDGE